MSPLSEGGTEAGYGFTGLGSRDFWWQLLKARGLRALWWQLLWGVWLHLAFTPVLSKSTLGHGQTCILEGGKFDCYDRCERSCQKRGGASVAWQHFLRGCMAARHPGASTCTLLPADNAASAVLAELLGVRVGMP